MVCPRRPSSGAEVCDEEDGNTVCEEGEEPDGHGRSVSDPLQVHSPDDSIRTKVLRTFKPVEDDVIVCWFGPIDDCFGSVSVLVFRLSTGVPILLS